MVGLGRFELPTSPLSGVRSNQLSYRPKIRQVEPNETLTLRLIIRMRMMSLELSRKVSRTQLNMRSDYVAMTIVKQDCEKEKVEFRLMQIRRNAFAWYSATSLSSSTGS